MLIVDALEHLSICNSHNDSPAHHLFNLWYEEVEELFEKWTSHSTDVLVFNHGELEWDVFGGVNQHLVIVILKTHNDTDNIESHIEEEAEALLRVSKESWIHTHLLNMWMLKELLAGEFSKVWNLNSLLLEVLKLISAHFISKYFIIQLI